MGGGYFYLFIVIKDFGRGVGGGGKLISFIVDKFN